MIYFVRHGSTDWNEHKNKLGILDPKAQGVSDVELNEHGREQAKTTAQKLKNIVFQKVLCSPLKRAKQTCAIVNVYNAPVQYDERLRERNLGEFEGKCISQFNNDNFWSINNEYFGKGAEKLSELRSRVFSFITELEKYPKEENVLIVSHGGVGAIMAEYFLGAPKSHNYFEYYIPNCSYLVFDFLNSKNSFTIL